MKTIQALNIRKSILKELVLVKSDFLNLVNFLLFLIIISLLFIMLPLAKVVNRISKIVFSIMISNITILLNFFIKY